MGRVQYKPWRGITWLAIRWRAQLYVLVWYESQDLFTNFSNAKGGLNFGCWSRLIQGYKNRLSASLVGDHSLVGVLSSNYSNTWIPANSHGIFMTSNFAWVATTSVDWITIELNWMLKKFRTELQWESGIEWILVKIWFSKKFIVIWLNGEKDN